MLVILNHVVGWSSVARYYDVHVVKLCIVLWNVNVFIGTMDTNCFVPPTPKSRRRRKKKVRLVPSVAVQIVSKWKRGWISLFVYVNKFSIVR